MVIGFALIFEGETSVGDVVEVLEPLEEGNCDTTSVNVQVGDDQDVAVDEDLVSRWSGGAVGGFGNDLQIEVFNLKTSFLKLYACI